MYNNAKMAKKMYIFSEQIRSYIENYCILGIQANIIFNKIFRVYENHELSFPSVIQCCKDLMWCRFRKKCTSCNISKKVEKINVFVANDARFTTRHITQCHGIPVGAAHTIIRRYLELRRICAR